MRRSNIFFCFSGNPYFRAMLSIFGALSIYTLNVSQSEVGSGYAEHGDGTCPYIYLNNFEFIVCMWIITGSTIYNSKHLWLFTCEIGKPVMSRNENRNFWIRWSPYEFSVGRGLTVDSGLIESETHPAPIVSNYSFRAFTYGPGNFAWLSVHYG